MYKDNNKGSYGKSVKSIALLASLLLIMGIAVGGTIAFLVDGPKTVENTFIPSQVTTTVEETLNGDTKSDVKIKNTGDTEAWIRAAVVVTWQDSERNVYGQMPIAGKNYTNWKPGEGWVEGKDGFYYYNSPVGAQTSTEALITEISPIGTAPAAKYYLTVEIIGSGIQSVPPEAVEESWSNEKTTVKVNGDTLSITDKVTSTQ